MSARDNRFKVFALATVLAVSGMLLIPAACGPAPTPEVIEKEKVVEVTKIVEVEKEKEVEVVVTATPTPVGADRYGGTLYHTSSGSIERFYPPIHTSEAQMWRLGQVFGSLVSWVVGSTEGEVYPDLAESWDISDDGLEYTFHLREGAKFHNGDDVTAEDAAFSIQAYYAEEGLPYSAKFAGVDKVEALDQYTLKITLKSPNPYFLQDIASVRGSAVMPKKVVEEFGEDFGTSPETTVGSGPFKLAEWSDTQLVYEAFEDFYRGRPYLDRVVQKLVPDRATGALEFKAGNSDIEYLYSPTKQEFMASRELRKLVHDGLRMNTWWWWFNLEKPPFDDVRVRQAVNYAIDNAQVLQIARAGLAIPATQFIMPSLLGYDESLKYYERDPEKVKALLAEAGYPDGMDITVNVWNIGESVTEAQVLAAQLQEAGFRAEVVPTDFGTYVSEMEKGTYGFYLTGEALNPNTAADMMRFWHSQAPENHANYSNPEVDALLEQAFEELDLEKRGQLLAEAQKLILEDAAFVPYMHDEKFIAVQPWVHGLEDVNIADGPGSHYAVVFDKLWLDPDKRDR